MTTLAPSTTSIDRVADLLGDRADDLLHHHCQTIDQSRLHLPGPDFVDRIFAPSDRSPQVLRKLQSCSTTAGWPAPGTCRSCPSTRESSTRPARASRRTRTTSIRRRSSSWRSRAAATRSPRRSACSASVARKYAHKIPFLVKINHNEILSYPNKFDQTCSRTVEQAWNLGAAGIGATIYFGSDESRRQIVEVSEAFEAAHELGHVHGALVLHAQQRVQRRRRRLPRRPPT